MFARDSGGEGDRGGNLHCLKGHPAAWQLNADATFCIEILWQSLLQILLLHRAASKSTRGCPRIDNFVLVTINNRKLPPDDGASERVKTIGLKG